MSETGSLPVDTRVWPAARYLDHYKQSIRNPEALWGEMGRRLLWRKSWDKVLRWDPPFAQWFVGGELNASENRNAGLRQARRTLYRCLLRVQLPVVS